VPILVLHRASGRITVEPGRIDKYARRGGLQMVPAILDGDVCVKLLGRLGIARRADRPSFGDTSPRQALTVKCSQRWRRKPQDLQAPEWVDAENFDISHRVKLHHYIADGIATMHILAGLNDGTEGETYTPPRLRLLGQTAG
jgi:hypothetical protein